MRLNARGCTWFDRSCGDIMLRAGQLIYNATCDETGRCRTRVDAEPGVTYNWAVTGCNIEAEGPYATLSKLLFSTVFDDLAFITCNAPEWEREADDARSDASAPAEGLPEHAQSGAPYGSLAMQGAKACAAHRRATLPKMDPRLWRPLFPEAMAEAIPEGGGPGNTHAWLALHVRPSTCTFHNVAADDMTTYVFVRNASLRERYRLQYQGCLTSANMLRPFDEVEGRRGEITPFCWCFHKMRSAAFVDPRTFTSSCRDRRLLCGSTFALEVGPSARTYPITHLCWLAEYTIIMI